MLDHPEHSRMRNTIGCARYLPARDGNENPYEIETAEYMHSGTNGSYASVFEK
jgi:hypothetical protein